jgi:hypothetical protein
MPDESPDQISDEIQRLLQQSILDNFPNPERRGCPGDAVLREVARRPVPIRDAHWDHVTHCSPCFREFLAIRREMADARRHLVRRTRVIVASAVIVVAAAGVALWRAGRSTAPAPIVAEAEFNVDMRPFTVSRGESANRRPADQYCGIFSRNRGRINVILPVGSPEGKYEVRLMDNDLRSVMASGTAQATLSNFLNRLAITFDLTRIPEGSYVLASRPGGGGWMTCPVLIR